MKAIRFINQTHTIRVQVSEDGETLKEVDLPFHLDTKQGVCVSCWQPNEEELAQIAKTKRIWVVMPTRFQLAMNILAVNPFTIVKKLIGLNGKLINGKD
jgi:hypothetical protein